MIKEFGLQIVDLDYRFQFMEDLGLTLRPGDDHYRAYVGPPEDYDLVSAMCFNLLTSLGLRQHHRMLDIGCGSLRIARLIIPYLNQGNYFGIEPNQWLVEQGIQNELGQDLVRLKQPKFSFKANTEELSKDYLFDFVLAQSIFSHCGLDLIEKWLVDTEKLMSPSCLFLATIIEEQKDFNGKGWIYPGCVGYLFGTIQTLANKTGLQVQKLDWKHPRQSWICFFKQGANSKMFSEGIVNWNKYMVRKC